MFFLHQTTTCCLLDLTRLKLYLMFFLHQTTTRNHTKTLLLNCILCSFYIKPQLGSWMGCCCCIVSYVLSTSNHNHTRHSLESILLYLMFFLHQTTTVSSSRFCCCYCILCSFYIKPQHIFSLFTLSHNCILCSFYIKPQLQHGRRRPAVIVSYVLSTSNHNSNTTVSGGVSIVSYVLSTSNHNLA